MIVTPRQAPLRFLPAVAGLMISRTYGSIGTNRSVVLAQPLLKILTVDNA